MPAGYSGTPLLKKLGLKEGMTGYAYEPSPALVEAAAADERELVVMSAVDDCPAEAEYVHLFLKERALLEIALPILRERIKSNGMVWVSWPKKASKVPTEIYDADVRACGLAAGLVDIKVCAVDEVWSGLKFMIRVKDRV